MSFLAELLAVMVVWLSSLALCQFGVVVDKEPRAKPVKERVVSRSPRVTPSPIAVSAPNSAAASS
jgi:hypothetical protein